MRRDLPGVGCGWLVGHTPDRCCVNPAVVLVESRARQIVACGFHRDQAERWAADGGPVVVTELDGPSTLF